MKTEDDPNSNDSPEMSRAIQNTLRCTVSSCGCQNFIPNANNQRECAACSHGWIPHAEEKVHYGFSDLQQSPQPINVDVVFDLASLILYGSQAIPVKLKILLDKLFARLQHNEVLQVIYSLAWTYEDYVRGYKYKEGLVTLNSWIIPSHEEERTILQHFTKFTDTREAANKFIHTLENGSRQIPCQIEAQSAYQSRLRKIIATMPSNVTQACIQVPSLFPTAVGDLRPQFPARNLTPFPTATKTQIVNPVPKITSPAKENEQSADVLMSQNSGFSGAVSTKSTPSLVDNTVRTLQRCSVCRRTFRSPLMFRLHRNLHYHDSKVTKKKKVQSSSFVGLIKKEAQREAMRSDFSSNAAKNVTSNSHLNHPLVVDTGCERSKNEIQNLEKLVAHLEKAGPPNISPGAANRKVLRSSKSDVKSEPKLDVSEYPPNASLELGPGGTMIPTLNSKSAASAASTGSMSQTSSGNHSENSTIGSPSVDFDLEVPVFGETIDGLICGICHKTYKNKTCLKQHFNNVHLRLQHFCWIEGCNSSFPSKRSRDRHSLNYNLHSHLMQNSGDVIDFSIQAGQSETSAQNTSSGSPESVESDWTIANTENSEGNNQAMLGNHDSPETSKGDEMSIEPPSQETNQPVVVWPKPAPIHGNVEF